MYALAKELKLDSKDLVDICTKAGVPGKGSALASLTDEEVVKVKQYLSGGAGGTAKAKPAAQVAPAAKAAPEVKQPVRPAKREKPAEPAVLRREDYRAPAGVSKKMPVLNEPAKRTAQPVADKPDAGMAPKPQRLAPAIRLAPLPPSEAQPKKTAKSAEPAAQKPDVKLPPDAIRAAKSGSARPLAAQMQRTEKKVKADKVKRAAAPAAGAPTETTKAKPPRRGKGPWREDEPAAKPAASGRSLLGGREARQLNRKRAGRRGDETERPMRRQRRPRRQGVSTAAPRKENVTLELPATVRNFSEASGVPAAQILRILLREGSMANLATLLDEETAEFLAAELGIEINFRQHVTLEDQLLTAIRDRVDIEGELVTRPPVITFLGHVDHGKTSLLDRIIDINVVSGESGGITQHIRAYEVDKDGRKIAFVDTPGHEAFTEMRARGANVTDIAVLVVAADDGVMPQTEEAISHARAANVPIVVALNKIDLPGVDINRTYQELSTNGLLPSEWGGDVEVVKTSATTGEGIDDLLETLLTVAELHDYKANPNRQAYGTCLEAQQEPGRGVIAKLIVQNGSLNVGDVVVCGTAFGRVKAMYDTLKPTEKVSTAGPSTPVNVTGFDEAPAAGEGFYVLEDIAQARMIAANRAVESRAGALGGAPAHVTLENLFDRLSGEGQMQTLNIILRADVRGSIEALQKELSKLQHEEVQIKVLQATVGGVTAADVALADASDAIIIGFNVVPEEDARALADRRGVQIRRYEVIYKVTEELKAALEGMLKPEQREVELGRALVQQTFTISRVGTIAGCRVLSGTIQRDSRARVIRNSTIIGDYAIDSVRREKNDVKEVREGMECGIKIAGYNDLKEADVLEVYKVQEFGRKFDE